MREASKLHFAAVFLSGSIYSASYGHAGFTADAALVVEVHDPVGPPEQSERRTDRDARRIVAVVAPEHGEVPARVGILSFFDVFDPGAIHADGDVVLFFAGNRTGMAADTAMLINEKSVAHSKPFKSEKLPIGQTELISDSREKQEGSSHLNK